MLDDDFEILFREKRSNGNIIKVSKNDPLAVFSDFQRIFDQKFPERTAPKKKNKIKKGDVVLDDDFKRIMGEESDFNL